MHSNFSKKARSLSWLKEMLNEDIEHLRIEDVKKQLRDNNIDVDDIVDAAKAMSGKERTGAEHYEERLGVSIVSSAESSNWGGLGIEGSTKRALLADLDLFRKLRADELDRLVAFTRWTRPKARTILFRKSDPGTSMMLVREGRVKVCTHSEDGKELVLNMFGPGEVFGEIALLDGSPRTADAVTMDDCELLVLDRRDFIPFLLQHSDASVRMLEVLTQRLRRTTQLLEDVAFREGPSRLARRFMHLAEFSGREVESGVFVDMPLSQQQLGNMVGMTRENINKQLRQWRDEGLISWARGFYTIRDLESFRALAAGGRIKT